MSKRSADASEEESDSKRSKTVGKWHYAMICSSNMNRSCAGHKILHENNLKVASYGAGAQVKIPGVDGARCFKFGTSYDEMYKSLEAEDKDYYEKNEMLPMLDRNRKIKTAPERWQDADYVGQIDVAVAFEERVYELVEEDLQIREPNEFKPFHLINIETKDNPKAAAKSAELALEFCQQVEGLDDLEDSLDDIVEAFQEKHGVELSHNMHLL